MFARKTYKPIRHRQIKDGKIDVSREELEDFRRQFGKDLTLRDLLNYDKTQRLPAAPKSEDDQRSHGGRAEKPKSEDDQRARGTQEANIRPNGGAGRGASSGPAADAQYKAPLSSEAADLRAAEGMDRHLTERAEQLRQADLMRPGRDAITPTLGPEMGLAAAGRTGLALLANTLASAAGRRTAAEGAKRTVQEAARKEPAMYGDTTPPKVGGVFRSARPPAPKPTPAPKPEPPKPRIQVEGTKGGVYRSPKDEAATKPQPEFRSRTADRMDEKEMLKKGGTTKAYAKGGSVKGSGCEQRGLRKCKVY